MPRRPFTPLLQIVLMAVATASPAWAAGEAPGGFQGWLLDHRPLLWKVFYVQLALFMVLAGWEAFFQLQRKKNPPARQSAASSDDSSSDPLAHADPFKTQATSRRPPPASSALGSDTVMTAPPSLAQIARSSSDEEPRGGRRLERIESGDATPAPRRPTPPAPPPPSPAEASGESWADVLKRTTQEGSERPQRRPGVQIPAPSARAGGRLDPVARKTEPESEPEPKAVSPESPALSDDDMVQTRAARTVRPGVSPPSSAPAGGVRMPAGTTRYAWDHAVQLLQAALVLPCRLVPGSANVAGAVAGPSATLNLVTPPPAAAEKKRGRGMKLAAGGETRLGETYGRTTPPRPAPLDSEPVPGFTGVIKSAPPPPALQPVKRVGEPLAPPPPAAPRSLSPPTTRMVAGLRPDAPDGGAPPAPPGDAAPPRPPQAAAPPRPTLSPPTTRMGPSGPAPPPAPRRSLDLPTRRIDIEPRTAEALREVSRGAPDALAGAGSGDPSIQKENPDPLRKSDGSSNTLGFPRVPGETPESRDNDPNHP